MHAHYPSLSSANIAKIGCLTVDVGNSAIKLAVWPAAHERDQHDHADHAVPIAFHTWPWSKDANKAEAVNALVHLCQQWSGWPVGLCSVVSHLTPVLQQALGVNHPVNVLKPASLLQPISVLQPGASMGKVLSLGAYSPQQLGVDRWVNAVAAATYKPQQPCMIISMGTSTTIDYVTDTGQFAGGSIVPGMRTWLNSLHLNTDGLPIVDLPDNPLYSPGTTTHACLQTGLALGYPAVVQAHVEQWRPTTPPCTVIITGGDASAFLRLCPPALANQLTLMPYWTHMGIRAVLSHLNVMPPSVAEQAPHG
jgi:pantothenate kinase type III